MPRHSPPRQVRPLHVEPLEARRLLAVVQVNTPADVVDGTTTSIADLIASPGSDGKISLREALIASNNTLGADEVTFDPAVFTETDGKPDAPILLTLGELEIAEATSVIGLGPERTRIDAQGASRVIDIGNAEDTFPATLRGLFITGGVVTVDHGWGGGVRMHGSGKLTIEESVIDGNMVTGSEGWGGGISGLGEVELFRVTVSNNTVTGFAGRGGGLNSYRDLVMTESHFINNKTTGYSGRGGGVHAFGNASLNDSSITGNKTTDTSISSGSSGGGMYARFAVVLKNSIVSNNSTAGQHSDGGGIHTRNRLNAFNSTISGNSTSGVSAVGGGILVDQTLRLYDSQIIDNATHGDLSQGGGIVGNRRVLLTNTVVAGNTTAGRRSNAGGISANDLRLTNSTVRGNSTAGAESRGGGILTEELTSNNSTISGNSTAGEGSYGGGISATNVQMFQSTVSGNSTSGENAHGGGVFTRMLALVSSTIVDNAVAHDAATAGGVYMQGAHEPRLNSSIVAGNVAGGTGPDFESSALAHNTLRVHAVRSLIGDNSRTQLEEAPVGGPDINGSLIGGPIHGAIVPLLGPLADNGGPTWTHLPLPGSPVIDAGDNPVGFTHDQRGEPFSRVFGAGPDMGAVESSNPFLVDNPTDESDGDLSLGDVSLREAIEFANANPGPDVIHFDPTVFTATTGAPDAPILLTLGQLEITDELTIDGLGVERTKIDAQGNSRIFDIGTAPESIPITLRALYLTGGRTMADNEVGGAVRKESFGELRIEDSTIRGNETHGSAAGGGGISVRIFAPIFIENTDISDNHTYGNSSPGGGIRVSSFSPLTIESSLISGNSTSGLNAPGGGVLAHYSGAPDPLTMRNTTVTQNRTLGPSSSGAGISYHGVQLVVDNSNITNNFAVGVASIAGGMFMEGGGTVRSTIIAGNNSVEDFHPELHGSFELFSSIIGNNQDTVFNEAPLGSPDANGNLIGGPINGVIDPLLAPLADNGGPTMTHALLPGSPAIDRGANPLGLLFDQRGGSFPRTIGAATDIGAFESDLTAPTVAITPVAPDPREGAVEAIDIVFSEPVTGFDLGDLILDRAFDGRGNLLVDPAFGAPATLTTSDHQTFTLGGLTGRTAIGGQYTLSLAATGSGVQSTAGAPLESGDFEQWTNTSEADATPPTVRITPVSPDPTTEAVDAIEIVFSEPVIGFDVGDLNLDQTFDGLGNRLVGSESLTTADDQTFVLSGLAAVTAPFASYIISLQAAGSGIADAAGNPLANNGHDRWTRIDAAPPTADIIDVSPDPRRNQPVSSIDIVFFEPVTGFDLSDLTLTRMFDSRGNLLTGDERLTTVDGLTYTLGRLGRLTAGIGDYTLTLTAAGSGIADLSGNLLEDDAEDQWRNNITIG